MVIQHNRRKYFEGMFVDLTDLHLIRDFSVSNDGEHLFIADSSDGIITQYDLRTSFAIDTYIATEKTYETFTGDGGPCTSMGYLVFSVNGKKMYVNENNGKIIYEFDLATAWDISTVSYNSVNHDFSAQLSSNYIRTFALSNDGKKLILCDSGINMIRGYTMAIPWNLSTISSDGSALSPTSAKLSYSLCFSDDGTKVFVGGGYDSGNLYMYDLTTLFDINSGTYSGDSIAFTGDAYNKYYGICFQENGTSLFLRANGGIIRKFKLTTAWDITTAKYQS